MVERILATPGFQRASQLRKILAYITTFAILHPAETLREYQIACEVLGRRQDFDPVSDNIVRAQMSHLRKKLDAYYAEEGKLDTLRLTIPKGSYLPHFSHNSQPDRQAPRGGDSAPRSQAQLLEVGFLEKPTTVERNRWSTREHLLLATVLLLLVALCSSLFWTTSRSGITKLPAAPTSNAFVRFLSRSHGAVAVILPDTSLMLLQQTLHTYISAEDYARSDYLQQQVDAVQDPVTHELLSQLRKKRNTSIGETLAAADFARLFNATGVPNSIRYARDIHVRDLNEGNTILIGSRKSNPWTSLFSDRMNFRFLQDPVTHLDYFENVRPANGEVDRYIPYQNEGGRISSYIDVALLQNLTSSGYVLLFNGSDSQSVEASVHFLLHGKLPPAVEALLKQDDPAYFEIFLRGTHAEAESNQTFEVLGVRSASSR